MQIIIGGVEIVDSNFSKYPKKMSKMILGYPKTKSKIAVCRKGRKVPKITSGAR
jgi:hypothetical protein